MIVYHTTILNDPEDFPKNRAKFSQKELEEWDKVVSAGVAAQRLVQGAVAVGGTACAPFAGHRLLAYTDGL